MKQEITITLTAQEAVFLIGFKALPKSLTNKVVAAIQNAGTNEPTAPTKRARSARKVTDTQAAPAPTVN